MGNVIAQRAGSFLEFQGFPGPNKNKRIAQWGECSPEMAKVLRRGDGWTVARLQEASRTWGWTFVEFVFQGAAPQERPYTRSPELEEMHTRLARLEDAAHERSSPPDEIVDGSGIGVADQRAQAQGAQTSRQGGMVGTVPSSARAADTRGSR